MIRLVLLIVVLIFSISCKKDRLKDERSFLIGTWNWTYSIFSDCSGGGEWEEILTPDSEKSNYQIVLHQKGFIEFFENGESIEKNRIVFDELSSFEDGMITFAILQNNDGENRIGAHGDKDSLYFTGFPYFTDESCQNYANRFVKQ